MAITQKQPADGLGACTARLRAQRLRIEELETALELAAKAEQILSAQRLRIAELDAYTQKLEAALDTFTDIHPASEYWEECGDVLWWNFSVQESPHLGNPLNNNWPGDGKYSHWSKLPIVWDANGMPRSLCGGRPRCLAACAVINPASEVDK